MNAPLGAVCLDALDAGAAVDFAAPALGAEAPPGPLTLAPRLFNNTGGASESLSSSLSALGFALAGAFMPAFDLEAGAGAALAPAAGAAFAVGAGAGANVEAPGAELPIKNGGASESLSSLSSGTARLPGAFPPAVCFAAGAGAAFGIAGAGLFNNSGGPSESLSSSLSNFAFFLAGAFPPAFDFAAGAGAGAGAAFDESLPPLFDFTLFINDGPSSSVLSEAYPAAAAVLLDDFALAFDFSGAGIGAGAGADVDAGPEVGLLLPLPVFPNSCGSTSSASLSLSSLSNAAFLTVLATAFPEPFFIPAP